MKKVLMLTTSFPLYQGHPAGVFVYEQARHLCRAGVSVDILAPLHPEGRSFEVMEGVIVRRFSYFWPKTWARLCYGDGIPENIKKQAVLGFQLPFLVIAFFFHTLRLARRNNVIYAHWSPAGLAGVLAGKIMKRPVVVMVHHGQERYGDNRLERFLINNAGHVICNSSYTMDRIIRYYKPRHCTVISPGVDTDVFTPYKIDFSDVFFKRMGIPDHLPVVLAMGRHIGWKGFAYLIEAAAQIKDQAPFVLVIGGQGPETGALRGKAGALGMRERIIFTGQIPNHDMPRLYNVVLMEAMACGVPCVASAVGGIPDIVKDGHNGFLVPAKDVTALADSILRLLNDKTLNEKTGQNGRHFIERNYSWRQLTAKTMAMLETLKDAV